MRTGTAISFPFWSVLAVVLLTSTAPVLAANVPCLFKSEGDTVDVKILVGDKTVWSGTLRKNDSQTVNIPEGPFILLSQVYNPNIDQKEEIRSPAIHVHDKSMR